MPTLPESGPGGLSHNHLWNNVFSINAKSLAMPRVILDPQDGITGLFDLPDTADPREKRTAAIGEQIYPDYPGGKTVVYKGELEAADEIALNTLRQQMRAAFAINMSSEGFMQIIPDAAFGDDVWSYLARPLSGGLTIDEGIHRSRFHPHGAFARTFQLSLRMSDPRFYLLSAHQVFDANPAGTYITVPNYDAPADPLFTISLPTSGLTVTLRSNTVVTSASGLARLRFGPFTGVSGTLVVDFREGGRSVTMAGIDVSQYIDSSYSNWWDELIPGLAPGNNDITVEGGGNWKVEYYPRCW